MTGTIAAAVIAAVAFVGGHFVLSWHPVRARLIAMIGENAFRGLYTVVAAATLFWLAIAHKSAPYVEVWAEPPGGRDVTAALMLLSAILVVLGLTTPNPTLAGMDPARADPGRGILAITRHPMLWGFALFGIAHLIVNGDAASIALFGGIAILALGGMAHIDARRQAAGGEAWAHIAATTSAIPFGAMIAGRAHLRLRSLLDWRLALGVAVYVALIFLHAPVIGVSPLPA